MAVPTIPSAIAATHIQTEFGGSNPIAINEYYAGGSYVPNPTANATAVNVPTSGQIAYSNFSGTEQAGPAAYVHTYNPYDYRFGQAASAYKYWFSSNGNCRVTLSGTDVTYTWVLSGSASSYDVRYTRTGGSTSSLTGTTNNVWYRVDAQRNMILNDPLIGSFRTLTANVQIKYNANSTVIDYNSCQWYAYGEGTGCPKCCFTPDTLISMADGTKKMIVDVNIGDEILTGDGSVAVTKIIARKYQIMYKLLTEDGLELKLSEDHPVYVIDKGWASISPDNEYKDIGIPEVLEVGDYVVDQYGNEKKIISLTEIFYPDTVYTFEESEFFANEVLVY